MLFGSRSGNAASQIGFCKISTYYMFENASSIKANQAYNVTSRYREKYRRERELVHVYGKLKLSAKSPG